MLLSALLPACGLASTQQQPVPVPVAVLTLAGQQAAGDIAAHLAATAAAAWEPDLAAWVAAAAPLDQVLAAGAGDGADADGSISGGGALVAVASVAEAPDESLAAALAFLAERAPVMEQVRNYVRCVCVCVLVLGRVVLHHRAGSGAVRSGSSLCASRVGDRPCGNATWPRGQVCTQRHPCLACRWCAWSWRPCILCRWCEDFLICKQ